MKIVYAFPEPLPLPRARGVQVVNAIASLADQGVDITLAYCSTDENPFAHYGVAQPANVTLVPISRGLPWPLHKLRAHSNKLFSSRLREWLKSNGQFDYIFVRHLKLAYALLVKSKIPLVYEAHEVFTETAPADKKDKIKHMEQLVAENAHVVIANSQATADCLKNLYAPERAVHVLPNGVTLPRMVAEKDWEHANKHIIYAGSLFVWKGVEDLILAARHLHNARISIIGGSADAISKLNPLIADDGAEIHFSGHVAHFEVMRYLNDACIAVLPNRADPDSRFTSPIKLFEYMAAGCAIVASDLPPLREIAGNNEVLWVEPNNPTALAAGINRLIADTQLAKNLGEKARKKAAEFTWKARATKVKNILAAGLGKNA
jgi:glycosyltransferase involved in cell wall biosynthesis